MTNRAMDVLRCTVLAGMVASGAVSVLHSHPASAADDCMAKPKGVAPSGQHWYYRSDRATKRQCWYLADEAPRGASLGIRKSAAVVAHRHHQQLSQAAADAHAEFPSPAVPATDVRRDLVAAAPAALPAPFLAENDPVTARVPDNGAAAADQSAITSRWPEASNAVPPAPIAPPSRAAGQFTMAAAETPSVSVDSTPVATTAAVLPVSDASTADTPVAAPPADPSRTQLAALLGAVALIGFSTSVLLARARARRRIRLAPVAQRRPRWPADPQIDPMQLPDVDRLHPALARGSEAAPRRPVRPSIVPRDDARYDEQYEVEDLLARYGGKGRSTR